MSESLAVHDEVDDVWRCISCAVAYNCEAAAEDCCLRTRACMNEPNYLVAYSADDTEKLKIGHRDDEAQSIETDQPAEIRR